MGQEIENRESKSFHRRDAEGAENYKRIKRVESAETAESAENCKENQDRGRV
jgi:hypothetical protein